MADIRLNGQTYYNIDNVTLPTATGGTATFGSGSGTAFAPEYVSFSGYEGQTLTLSGLDTSNVTIMSYMFSGCTQLTGLDVSGFDTSSVIDMSGMFNDCQSLTSLDLSSFNTSNVTSMSYMFYFIGLTSLDLSNFDTSNVTDMSGMFSFCGLLQELDIRNFDISNANISGMFEMMGHIDDMTGNYDTVIYVNQATYDILAADYYGSNTCRLADLSMLHVV